MHITFTRTKNLPENKQMIRIMTIMIIVDGIKRIQKEQKEYRRRHDNVARIVVWRLLYLSPLPFYLCKKYNLERTEK